MRLRIWPVLPCTLSIIKESGSVGVGGDGLQNDGLLSHTAPVCRAQAAGAQVTVVAALGLGECGVQA